MTTVSPYLLQDVPDISAMDPNIESFEMPPFDPAIHLNFEAPSARHSFTELGLEKPKTAPDMCFTEPFQLFSEEGVRMLRRDLLRKEVLDNHMTTWVRAPCSIGSHEKVTPDAVKDNAVSDFHCRLLHGSIKHGTTLPPSNASAKRWDIP